MVFILTYITYITIYRIISSSSFFFLLPPSSSFFTFRTLSRSFSPSPPLPAPRPPKAPQAGGSGCWPGAALGRGPALTGVPVPGSPSGCP